MPFRVECSAEQSKTGNMFALTSEKCFYSIIKGRIFCYVHILEKEIKLYVNCVCNIILYSVRSLSHVNTIYLK